MALTQEQQERLAEIAEFNAAREPVAKTYAYPALYESAVYGSTQIALVQAADPTWSINGFPSSEIHGFPIDGETQAVIGIVVERGQNVSGINFYYLQIPLDPSSITAGMTYTIPTGSSGTASYTTVFGDDSGNILAGLLVDLEALSPGTWFARTVTVPIAYPNGTFKDSHWLEYWSASDTSGTPTGTGANGAPAPSDPVDLYVYLKHAETGLWVQPRGTPFTGITGSLCERIAIAGFSEILVACVDSALAGGFAVPQFVDLCQTEG